MALTLYGENVLGKQTSFESERFRIDHNVIARAPDGETVAHYKDQIWHTKDGLHLARLFCDGPVQITFVDGPLDTHRQSAKACSFRDGVLLALDRPIARLDQKIGWCTVPENRCFERVLLSEAASA